MTVVITDKQNHKYKTIAITSSSSS